MATSIEPIAPWVTQREAQRLLGEKLTLHINPQSISGFVGSKMPLTVPLASRLRLSDRGCAGQSLSKTMNALHPQVIPTSRFPRAVPFTEVRKYRRVKELIQCDGDYKATAWYSDFREALKRDGTIVWKGREFQSLSDIDCFFQDDMLGMIQSLLRDGYREDIAPDVGTAMIGADGKLSKSGSGMHRFAAARELGIEGIPVVISCIDRSWIRSVNGGFRHRSRRHRLGLQLQSVETAHQ